MSPVPSLEQTAIASFVRQQRQKALPEAFPRLVRRRRHVPHLTQADLAELAGVSEAAIAQIESSRYPNLNANMLRRICRALELRPVLEHYVVNLLTPPTGYYSTDEVIPTQVRAVVDAAQPDPAVVINARLDVLYWNESAAQVLGDFAALPPEDRNTLVMMACLPDSRERWVEVDSYIANAVGALKIRFAGVPDYRVRIMELVTRLSNEVPGFAELWEETEPIDQPIAEMEVEHPVMGHLKTHLTVSEVLGSPHLSIIQFVSHDEQTAAILRGQTRPHSLRSNRPEAEGA